MGGNPRRWWPRRIRSRLRRHRRLSSSWVSGLMAGASQVSMVSESRAVIPISGLVPCTPVRARVGACRECLRPGHGRGPRSAGQRRHGHGCGLAIDPLHRESGRPLRRHSPSLPSREGVVQERTATPRPWASVRYSPLPDPHQGFETLPYRRCSVSLPQPRNK